MIEPLFSAMSLPGSDDIVRHEFPNGVVLLTRPNFNSPAISIRGFCPPGSAAEPDQKWGLAHFTASMLMAGTKKHAFREFHEKIESLGASLSIGSGALNSIISGQCLNEDLPQILTLLTEILESPAFPPSHFQRIKTQTLTLQAIQSQETAEMASQAFDRNIYGQHPYGRPDLGTPKSIQDITLDDLWEFQQQFIGPQGLVIAISGGLSPEEVIKACEISLAEFENPRQEPIPPLPLHQPITSNIREHVTLKEKSQTDLVIGTMAPKTYGPDYHACRVGNSILGQFGMMGRIGEAVREKAGLAYYIQSELGAGLGPTTWQIVAGVNPDNLDKAKNLIMAELQRYLSEPVSSEELADARSQMIGRLPLSLESNAGVAGSLLNIERFGLELDYLRMQPEKLAAITPQTILEASQRYWDLDRLVITSAGRALS